MPIVILEIPRNSQINILPAKELCQKAGDCLHDALNIPISEDNKGRVIKNSVRETTLRIAFTIGPNKYPDYEPKSFLPSQDQIAAAGQSILNIVRGSDSDVSQVIIEAWQDTTFALREKETAEPVSPVSEETLKEIGSHLSNPRLKLILPYQKQEGVSAAKELGSSKENTNYQKVVVELLEMTEMLGLKKVVEEIEYADFTDTDVAIEFDCDVEPKALIPPEVREYMAAAVLQILDSNRVTKDGSGEVWIRQGQPERYVFDR